VPLMQSHGVEYARWYANDNDYGVRQSKKVTNATLAFCQMETENGLWRAEYIGPFTSSGGYDWWQFGWKNALHLEDFTQSHIIAHWTGPVLADGSPLGMPPIHQHHVHLTPCSREVYCRSGLRVLEHHGDWQFRDEEGGVNSFGQFYGGASKTVTSISLSAELNDVRLEGSTTMTWYYRIALLIGNTNATKLSLHRIHGPGQSCSSQFCDVFPFPVPSGVDTFTIYGGVMPYGGIAAGIVFHAHQSAFHGALFFSGNGSLLRKTDIGTVPAFQTTLTSSTPFKSNDRLQDHLLMRLPNLVVCHAKHASQTVHERRYDRAPVPKCSPWSFETGDAFTVVTFNGPTKFAVPSDIVREHAIWYITYISADYQSHYTETVCMKRDLSLWRSTLCTAQAPSLRHGIISGEHEDPFVTGSLMFVSSIVLVLGGLLFVRSGKARASLL